LQNSTALPDKSSEETKNIRQIPQHYKGYIGQTYSHQNTKCGKTEAISSYI
jgi:hypothetical protein